MKIPQSLAFDRTEGQVSWRHQRLALFDDEATGVMREQLVTTLGADMARALLIGWGHELGRRDALSLGRAFSWENDTQLLLMGPRLQPWLETATMETRRVTLNRARGLVDLEVMWRNSREAEQYVEHMGRAEHPVCWTLVGYYSGYCSTLLGRQVLAVETTCAGMGAEACTIRLRGREVWDQGGRPAQTALQPGHAVRVMQGELERLRFESSMRLNRLEALREAVLDVTGELSLDGVQAKIVSRGRVLLGARYGFLVMFSEHVQPGYAGSGQLPPDLPRGFVVVHDGLSQQDSQHLDPFPIGSGLFGAVLRENATIRVRRITDDLRARGMPGHHAFLSSFLGVPVRVHGQLCGALYFTDRLDGSEFSLDDEKLAESFAAHAGVAVENARLVEAYAAEQQELLHSLEREQEINTELSYTRQALERERHLMEALLNIPSLPDLDSALHVILGKLLTLLEADVGSILLCSPEGCLLQVRACVEQGRPLQIPTERSLVATTEGLAGRVATTRDVVYVRDVTEEPHLLDPYLADRGVRSLLGAPLDAVDGFIGVVQVGSYAVRTFDGPEVRFLRAAARSIASSAEHTRLHQENTRSAKLLQAVIEAAPIGMAVTLPPDGMVYLSNGVMRRLEDVARAYGVAAAADAPGRALQGETVSRMEQTLPGESGPGNVAVRISAAPVLDEGGTVQAAVTVVEELTLEKELERLRERFVSLVAHDLRNPLNAAMMHLELLRERLEAGLFPDMEPAGAYQHMQRDCLRTAEAIGRSMDRVSGLVSDLLDYSRIEAGQLTIHKSDVALPALLRELLDEMRPLLGGRQVEVEVDEGLPPLRADRRRLAQVLTNLLSNALKYTPPSARMGVRAQLIDASRGSGPQELLEQLPAGQPFVLLTVWDEGPGIPHEGRQRLFDPFYRLARDEKRDGTGLGLYITRGLCEAHGGQIWIDDVEGASFSMLWPTA